MNVVETGEWIALEAATRNVVAFISATKKPRALSSLANASEEKSATPDPARETGCEGPDVAEAADAHIRDVGSELGVTTDASVGGRTEASVVTTVVLGKTTDGDWWVAPVIRASASGSGQ